MAITIGSLWVEGDYLYFSPQYGQTYRYLGLIGDYRSGAIPGSIWTDSDLIIRYIDSSNYERRFPYYSASTPTGIDSSINGSIWIESSKLCISSTYSTGSQKYKVSYHQDEGHTDNGSHSDHDDLSSSHSDSGAHGDSYTNHNDFSTVPGFHVDSYLNNGSHQDFSDISTTHADIEIPFYDTHIDYPQFVHGDFTA
jgi:hypothetical protein